MTHQLQDQINLAAAALKSAGASEVYLFGSAAHATMDNTSDIDLAVSGLPPENFFSAMGEAGELLPRSLDLVDLDENTPFTRYLKEENELVRIA